MSDDLERQTKQRVVDGRGDALDDWRMRAFRRQHPREQEQREPELPMDAATQKAWDDFVIGHIVKNWNDVMYHIVQEGMANMAAEVIEKMRAELTDEIQKLKIEIAELKGELRGLRGAPGLIGVDGTKLQRSNGASADGIIRK
jgi:hypothetical protein